MNKILEKIIKIVQSSSTTVDIRSGDMYTSYIVHNTEDKAINYFSVTKSGSNISIEGLIENSTVDFPTVRDKKSLTEADHLALNKIFILVKSKT